MPDPNELKKSIANAEAQTGKFSEYKCLKDSGTEIDGRNIPSESRPAAQLLNALGYTNNKEHPNLTTMITPGSAPSKDRIEIRGYSAGSEKKLTITQERLTELRNSARVFINPNKMTYMDYRLYSKEYQGESTDRSRMQTLAVGICHAQEIDLLVSQENKNEVAYTTERTGVIDKGARGITLLSTPALDFKIKASAAILNDDQRREYIADMFRTIFSSAKACGNDYITMPPAGLGVFGGDPEMYFSCLFNVAKEYPDLNIIYNPVGNRPLFEAKLQKYEGNNVVVTDKDVLFLADNLAREGKKCALHNPSDADAVYGMNDIGQYWRTGNNPGRYVGEEHIGAMSTAPLNSRGINPKIYDDPVELNFDKKAEKKAADAPKAEDKTPNDNSIVIKTVEEQMKKYRHLINEVIDEKIPAKKIKDETFNKALIKISELLEDARTYSQLDGPKKGKVDKYITSLEKLFAKVVIKQTDKDNNYKEEMNVITKKMLSSTSTDDSIKALEKASELLAKYTDAKSKLVEFRAPTKNIDKQIAQLERTQQMLAAKIKNMNPAKLEKLQGENNKDNERNKFLKEEKIKECREAMAKKIHHPDTDKKDNYLHQFKEAVKKQAGVELSKDYLSKMWDGIQNELILKFKDLNITDVSARMKFIAKGIKFGVSQDDTEKYMANLKLAMDILGKLDKPHLAQALGKNENNCKKEREIIENKFARLETLVKDYPKVLEDSKKRDLSRYKSDLDRYRKQISNGCNEENTNILNKNIQADIRQLGNLENSAEGDLKKQFSELKKEFIDFQKNEFAGYNNFKKMDVNRY